MSTLNTTLLRPSRELRSTHEQAGFDLGRDHAHHGLDLPAPYGQEPSVLGEGLVAGRSAFGARVLPATPAVRQWLQLRLHAWLRGRSVELVQVTPNYLQQLATGHCPITRSALAGEAAGGAGASIDRVRNDAGYAAGNLAMMSRRANHAKGANSYRDVLRILAGIDDGTLLPSFANLDRPQWTRVAVLCSFVEALPHDEAAALPLAVLPPNRLRLFNPVQALQAFVSLQLLVSGWSRRVSRFGELLLGKPLQRDFKRFFMALLPRVLEAGRLAGGQATRSAIEDAWGHAAVQQRWTEFARQLTPSQCESLLARAAAAGLATGALLPHTDAGAVDGWHLETRGYVAPGRGEASDDGAWPPAQHQLAW